MDFDRPAFANCCQRVRRRLRGGTLVLVMALLSTRGALLAQEVGTVAAVDGSARIGRGDVWLTVTPGLAVRRGDEINTGRPGRLRIVFQDDTVLTLSDDSRVVVNEQLFDPDQGKARSVLGLLQGKVSALVSEYYQRAGAVYEIKTATAVAGVRGTEFVVSYDPADDRTEVTGLSGSVEVTSAFDRSGRGVFVTAQEVTTVTRNQLPSAPRRLSDSLFRQYIQGMDFVGAGAAESVTLNNPLLAGQVVPKADRAAVAVTAVAPQRRQLLRERRDVSDLLQETPAVFGSTGKLRIPF
ncbi:MAG TPA: FecR family protein [Candidatus Margulisiibacteriota bacterium]|nr:FecR family protein [Candidatus Margulisiibacteriota bacterium]